MGSRFARVLSWGPRPGLVLVAGLAGLPASVAAVFLGRGSVEHFLFAVVPALTVAPVCALGGLALWLYGLRVEPRRTSRRLRWLAAALVALAAFSVALAPSYLPGRWLNRGDVRAAKQYCEALVPRLEAWKNERGDYPPELAPVRPAERPVPRLLRGVEFYHRIGDGYEFFFLDPASISGGHSFFAPDASPLGRWESWS